MARPLRIAFPGAFYHVTARGNERKAVFKAHYGAGPQGGWGQPCTYKFFIKD